MAAMEQRSQTQSNSATDGLLSIEKVVIGVTFDVDFLDGFEDNVPQFFHSDFLGGRNEYHLAVNAFESFPQASDLILTGGTEGFLLHAVDFVEYEHGRFVVAPNLSQGAFDNGKVLFKLRMTYVDHMQQQIAFPRLVQR